MAKLLFQGHGSLRITAGDGRVIYVDPFDGEGYDRPASLILVTHQHEDHNEVGLCAQKLGCAIVTEAEALAGGKHNSFSFDGIEVQAVEAHNQNHKVEECVGYVITVDGVKIYVSGDTSRTKQMETFPALQLDYALLCGDGIYNMDPAEAAECARIIGAKRNILIHLGPGENFDAEKAKAWGAPNKLFLAHGEEISL